MAMAERLPASFQVRKKDKRHRTVSLKFREMKVIKTQRNNLSYRLFLTFNLLTFISKRQKNSSVLYMTF